jgi:CRP/FNR family transcriptional regulator
MEQLLLARTLADLEQARGWLTRVARASAAARVASFLGDMAQRLAVSDCRRDAGVVVGAQFDLPLRRGEIADLLGLTIETVSRQMTRLRAAGVIDLPGGRGIIVRDPAALADAAQG